jgi:hypothetical protein
MSLIRPSFTENLYMTLFQLEPDRPQFFQFVVSLSRNIFLSLGYEDKADMLDKLIRVHIEIPLQSDFISVCAAFYNPRFMFSKRAYTKVGDIIEYREVSRWEIQQRLEYIRRWCYDEIVQLSPYIRFTRPHQMLT